MEIIDCAIIGGGPAGLTAGLYASRGGLQDVVLFDKGMPGGQITSSSEIENYPGIKNSVTGLDLMEPWLDQATRFGLKFEMVGVERVERQDGVFVVHKENGEGIIARTVIVCTGSSPRKANIKGEDTYWGKGVSSCATCDGFFYKNKDVVVIGGGDAALEESLYLSQICSSVTIVHRRNTFKAAPGTIERVLKNEKIKIIYNAVVDEIVGDNNGVTGVAVNGNIIPVHGVFIFVGHNINNTVLQQKDGKFLCNVNGNKEVCVDLKMRTTVPGLFVAGDLREDAVKQVVCAAGDGAVAALSAIEFVNSQKE